MDRQVSAPVRQSHFQFLDKQPLAANFAERPVQYLIAQGCHAQQADLVPVLLQQGLHVLRLPKCQSALSCCYRQTAHKLCFLVVTCL